MAVRLEREGAVGVITLDRPPANSYDYDFLREFGAAVDDARVDEDIRAVVIASAAEKFFCAGADLKAFQAGSGAPLDLGLAIEREAIARIFVSEDADEGIRAFNEKRAPSYRGR